MEAPRRHGRRQGPRSGPTHGRHTAPSFELRIGGRGPPRPLPADRGQDCTRARIRAASTESRAQHRRESTSAPDRAAETRRCKRLRAPTRRPKRNVSPAPLVSNQVQHVPHSLTLIHSVEHVPHSAFASLRLRSGNRFSHGGHGGSDGTSPAPPGRGRNQEPLPPHPPARARFPISCVHRWRASRLVRNTTRGRNRQSEGTTGEGFFGDFDLLSWRPSRPGGHLPFQHAARLERQGDGRRHRKRRGVQSDACVLRAVTVAYVAASRVAPAGVGASADLGCVARGVGRAHGSRGAGGAAGRACLDQAHAADIDIVRAAVRPVTALLANGRQRQAAARRRAVRHALIVPAGVAAARNRARTARIRIRHRCGATGPW